MILKNQCPNPNNNPNCKGIKLIQSKMCRSCSRLGKNNPMFGKSRSDETKRAQREKMMGRYDGQNNPNYGNGDKIKGNKNPAKRPEVRKIISDSLTGRKFSNEHKKNMRKPKSEEHGKNISKGKKGCVPWNKGIPRTEITKLKLRLSANKRREKLYGQNSPNYNPVACEIIRWFNMYYDFGFQHAENGGEKCIGGYFPDGIDEKRKTIIEVDEKHHFNPNGTLKEKDIRRQNYLEGLGYKFIRIKLDNDNFIL